MRNDEDLLPMGTVAPTIYIFYSSIADEDVKYSHKKRTFP